MRTLLFKAMRILMITSIGASLLYSGLNTFQSLKGDTPGREAAPSGSSQPPAGERR